MYRECVHFALKFSKQNNAILMSRTLHQIRSANVALPKPEINIISRTKFSAAIMISGIVVVPEITIRVSVSRCGKCMGHAECSESITRMCHPQRARDASRTQWDAGTLDAFASLSDVCSSVGVATPLDERRRWSFLLSAASLGHKGGMRMSQIRKSSVCVVTEVGL